MTGNAGFVAASTLARRSLDLRVDMAWSWVTSLLGLSEDAPAPSTNTDRGTSAEDRAIIAQHLRADISHIQLKARDPVEAQLERMTVHCDAARRQARKCQLLLQQTISERDALRKELEQTRCERDALQSRIQQMDQLASADVQASKLPRNLVLRACSA